MNDIWESKVKPHLPTIIIYLVIILIVYWCITSESKDQNCSDTKGTNCGPGKGRAYYNSHPEPNDDHDTLVRKLQTTAKYDQLTVHWRTLMLTAVLSGFITTYVVTKKFPTAKVLGIVIIINFLIAYFAMIQFQRAVGVPAGKQIDAIAAQLLH